MEVSQQKNEKIGLNKRKRLDARVFKEWHISQAKKHSGLIRDENLQKSKENHEPNCSKEKNSPCEMQTIDSEVKNHSGSGEEISIVPQRSEDLLGCKTKVPRYIEYWVPVGLSYVQLEKYCEILIKNSMFLCSRVRNEILDDVHGILTTIRKCCDHPYLVDKSLQKFVNNVRPGSGFLCNDIEASGKLLLLDKLLREVKENQLRVLIVCQSNELNTQFMNIEDILDDLLDHRVGKGSYVHIYREADSAKKRAEVNLFNDKEQGKLVMLIEKSACQQNIKLSSLDCVILFNSDWNPTTDIKSLRKMSIESKFDHLKVFRFYTSKSVEEKALNLAKEGTSLEIGLNNISYNISHMLLLWGTSYLFSKLDKFHSCRSAIEDINCLSEDKLVPDVLNELSMVLSCQDSNNVSCSFISKVPEASADYSRNIALHGEQDEPARDYDIPPSTIWNSLLEGRNPLWKLLPGSSEKIRRRGEPLARTAQRAECDNGDAKIKKTPHSGNGHLGPKSRVGKVNKLASSKRAPIEAGYPDSRCNSTRSSSFREDYGSPSQIEETFSQKMRELIKNQKEEIREFYRTRSEARTKLEDEHQLEVELMSQRFGETPSKQEELMNLDLIYEQKFQEHNRLMDIKRKELEDEQYLSRKKAKQLKEKLISLFKMENVKTPTASLVKMSLENALPQQSIDLIGNSSESAIIVSNNSVSESNHSHEIDLKRKDASVQHNGIKCLPDHGQTETEILSVGFDEENDAVSTLREVSDSAESGTTATLIGQNRKQVQNGECNIEATVRTSNLEADLRGAADSDATAVIVHDEDSDVKAVNGEANEEAEMRDAADSVATATAVAQKRIEEVQDGDCKIDVLIGESNGDAELRDVPDSCTTATVAALQRIERVQDGDCNTEAIIGEYARGIELAASDSVTNAQLRREEVQDADCNTGALLGESNGEAVLRGAPDSSIIATVASQQRIEKVCNTDALIGISDGEAEFSGVPDSGNTSTVAQRMIEEVQDENCNSDALAGESIEKVDMRGAADLDATAIVAGSQIEEVQYRDTNFEYPTGSSNGEAQMGVAAGTSTTVVGQQRIDEPLEVAPSNLNVCSQVVQSQACTRTGNSPLVEQPMDSANLSCFESRETPGASAVSNFQAIRVHAPSQRGQTQVHLGNSCLSYQPVVQSRLQSPSIWEQPHPNSGMAIINYSANSCFQDSSSLGSNLLPSYGSDPLQNELLRMKKEEEEADKLHENKLTLLNSFYEKKIQEIQKQYDLLRRETENAYLQKKQELGSNYRKVYANMLLADTLRSGNEMPTTCPKSQDVLLPVQSSAMGSATSASAPVQVVNQLSELVTFGPTRPHTFSTLPNTRSPVAGNYARSSAPHLHPQSRQISSPSTLNMLTSSYGIMNQQAAVWPHGQVPGRHQPEVLPASSTHLGATPQNSLSFVA